MGRLVGIDYGLRRIGLAVCDPARQFSSPFCTLDARGGATMCAAKVVEACRELSPVGFVVGLPLHADGRESEQSRLTRLFADALRDAASLPVELFDERLSSFEADQQMDGAGVPRSRRRELQDALAAACILRGYLRNSGP